MMMYLAVMISHENILQETSKRTRTVNVLKFLTIFSLCLQIKCWLSRLEAWNSQNAYPNDPDLTAPSEEV